MGFSLGDGSSSFSVRDEVVTWTPCCRRNLADEEFEEFLQLLQMLEKVSPRLSNPDSIKWLKEKSGSFSMRSLCWSLCERDGFDGMAPTVWLWHYGAPLKAAVTTSKKRKEKTGFLFFATSSSSQLLLLHIWRIDQFSMSAVEVMQGFMRICSWNTVMMI
ncbi:uncharacterized protein LOC131240404 [Magnolia sinica]|uniref:uncharacterized protein LOC131240404 n=1 Tax=Magnolia sinica TaxID=86752 RepID=UPI002657B82E|nr:uncharacterized protein LOC131240404 [Magnolia sinica]